MWIATFLKKDSSRHPMGGRIVSHWHLCRHGFDWSANSKHKDGSKQIHLRWIDLLLRQTVEQKKTQHLFFNLDGDYLN